MVYLGGQRERGHKKIDVISTDICVEPLYKGQVVQWNLSTRDKLYSGTSLQGTSCTVEPLYKGQVEGSQR